MKLTYFSFLMIKTEASFHSVGDLGILEMPGEVGQSVGCSDGEQVLPGQHEVEAEAGVSTGGPCSIPAITVTHTAEKAATETEQEMPPPQVAGIVMMSRVHEFRALEEQENILCE
jgi:hypothetical protein